MKIRPVMLLVAALVLVLVLAQRFFTTYPSEAQVRQRVESILMRPDECQSTNPKMVEALKSIQVGGQQLHLTEKTNALPIRVDYDIKDGEGKVLGYLVYRVDGGCQGLHVILN